MINNKGFTLIELIVVITIISIIVVLGGRQYNKTTIKSKVVADFVTAKEIEQATRQLIIQDPKKVHNYEDDNQIDVISEGIINDFMLNIPPVKAIQDANWMIKIQKDTGDVKVFVVKENIEEQLSPKKDSYDIEPYNLEIYK